MFPNFALLIEILGTISFAMSGSFAAMQKRFDPFGVIIIASVTSDIEKGTTFKVTWV
jgi:uncharacterized membrane protein YeiH